ncbi:MAG: hypothetical protein KBD78_10445 [Oligoflexales bacterium]|nr:hypothetical protein [Oligoflexales bacterium]
MKKLLGLFVFTLAATSCGSKSSSKKAEPAPPPAAETAQRSSTETAPLRLTDADKSELYETCNETRNYNLTVEQQNDFCACTVIKLDKKLNRSEAYALKDKDQTEINKVVEPIAKACIEELDLI